MDKFSTSVLKYLIEHFPDLPQKSHQTSKYLEFEIPSPAESNIGGLVIQTTADKSIWVRNYHPYSAYSVDTVEELVTLLTGIFEDKILWAIGSRGEDWVETTLINGLDNLEIEGGVTYKILSWSGKLDKTFEVD